jgi:two-component system, NarL family, sensor kinase
VLHRNVVLAYGLFALSLLLAVVAIAGSLLAGVDGEAALSTYLVTNTAIGLSAAPCGFLIARAKPTSPIGWLFLGLGLAALGTAAMVPLLMYGDDGGSPSALLRLGVTVFQFSWGWGVFCFLPLALQLFPTGRPLNERWRALCWLTVATAAIGSVTGPTPEYGASSYLAVSWWRTAEDIVSVLAPVVVLLSVASLVLRFKRGDDVVRRQLLWLVAAVLLVVGVNVSSWFSVPTGREILLLLTFPLIPVAVTIAVLRHGLYDVRLVVSRLLAYGILSAGVVAIYLALVSVLDRTLRPTGAPVLATLAVALAFNPVRLRLQRLADRALFGLRRDPVLAVSAVGRRLAQDDLAGVLEALRDALRLPYVAIHSPGGTIASGVRDTTVYDLPLLHQGEPLGSLEVGARRGERRLSKADDSVLELLATPLAVALHATTLSIELQASRNRLIEATEHERQRLHRELHDSLGPLLTGAALKADGAALAARHNPERAGQLATELAEALRQAIIDIRHLVYGLRPPALDEHGLVDALRLQSGQLGRVRLSVDAPACLPTLSSSVEVAAYRIATEALTNVLRHSTARQATVSLTVDTESLNLIVTDDGVSSGDWRPGVGLQSISARAAEVGGACEAGPTPSGGRVVVTLPLGASA